MDYEKKYNEALERARALRREAIEKDYVEDYVKDYETIFPELRESEDERIRKFLLEYAIEMIACLESDISHSIYDGIKGHDPDAEAELNQWQKARAYLEKQKDHFRDDTKKVEQKPAEKEITLNGFEKVLDSFLFDFVHSPIIDCEPKEYIKNHSAYLLKAAYKELNAQLKQDFFEAQQEGRREGYEAAMAEQKPKRERKNQKNLGS